MNYLHDYTSPNRWTAAALKAQYNHIRVVDRAVLHITEGLYPTDAEYLCEPNPPPPHGPVSCNLLIDPNCAVHELVDCLDAAWGCYTYPSDRTDRPDLWVGAHWGDFNQNWNSINIEVSSPYGHGMSDAQRDKAAEVVAGLVQRFHIPFDRTHIVGHYELSIVKTDPPNFDWHAFWGKTQEFLGAPPPAPPPDSRYFPETGHHLGGGFFQFWLTNGQLPLFGMPLGEEVQEGPLTVQYLENVRFEYNPAGEPGHRVRVGALGRMYLTCRSNTP